jgi:cytochrome c oxidase cbb3-type subunit 1
MISATPNVSASEIDTTARGPLSLLILSAVKWLVLSGILSVIATIQLHRPSFLADCSLLTYGHVQALQETVFIYGWAANASFAVALWLLGRLGGAPLRGLGLLMVGTIFWNLGVTAGLGFILFGEATSIPFLQMPAYVHPLLLVSYAAIATPGILAWTGRSTRETFATQWYAVAALFLFPWLYSVAQVMLLDAPVRGVAQAVVAAWFSSNVVSLWLLPIALAAAYYLVPKLTGRTLNNYHYAPHGFWTLIFFAAWTGARHLVGGPVPAWIPTLAIVTTALLLFHFLVVSLNLRAGLTGGHGSNVLAFISLGLLAYLLGGIADVVFSFQHFAALIQFTYFPIAQLKLALVGAFSFPIYGALYYLVPRITGIAWPSAGLIRAHFGLSVLGLIVTVVSLAGAGWVQGQGLSDAGTSFVAIAASTKPWLMAATAGEGLLLLGTLVLAVNFYRLQAIAYIGLVRSSPLLEGSVS